MITGKSEELNDMAANNVCAADGGHLSVVWDAKGSVYYLRCGICNVTKGIQRVLSPTEEHKAGTELPPAIKDNVERGMAKRQAKHPAAPQAITFTAVPATDLGSGELLAPDMLQFLVAYARRYGLDPARGHVALMYGKPYIEMDGYLYHARRLNIPYQLRSRPLTEDERQQYQISKGDYAWLGEVTRLDDGSYFSGLGIITREELDQMSKKDTSKYANPVLRNKPWQMAQKRAEWQAMRRAFPIGESDADNV